MASIRLILSIISVLHAVLLGQCGPQYARSLFPRPSQKMVPHRAIYGKMGHRNMMSSGQIQMPSHQGRHYPRGRASHTFQSGGFGSTGPQSGGFGSTGSQSGGFGSTGFQSNAFPSQASRKKQSDSIINAGAGSTIYIMDGEKHNKKNSGGVQTMQLSGQEQIMTGSGNVFPAMDQHRGGRRRQFRMNSRMG